MSAGATVSALGALPGCPASTKTSTAPGIALAPSFCASTSPVAGATSYDLIKGELAPLRESAGDFSASDPLCLASDLGEATHPDVGPLPAGGAYYLVRARSCAGEVGSWDSGGAGQDQPRGASLPAAPPVCP